MGLRKAHRNFLFAIVAALALTAMPLTHALDSVNLELGLAESDEDAERYGVAFKWDWNAQWFTGGNWYLTGYWEAAAAYWDGEDGRTGNDGLGDFSITPVFQLRSKNETGAAAFFEFGVGAHVHTDSEIGDKDFDIPFAFGSHIGAGFRFGGRQEYELTYRFQHLSNAGLGDDNPGINFHVLHLGYRF